MFDKLIGNCSFISNLPPKLKKILSILNPYSLGNQTVFLTIDINNIRLQPHKNVDVESINVEDEEESKRFISIANISYDREENIQTFKSRLTESSLTNYLKAFIFSIDDDPIGTIAINNYKKNEKIGHLRYVSVLPSKQGQGWGKYISLFGLKELKKMGCTKADIETRLKRKKAIFL